MIAESFDIDSRRTGTTIRIAARGELDIASAPLLRDHVGDAADAEIVLLDLAGITFIDSTGLHALLDAVAAGHGRVRVVASPVCMRLFEITGVLDRIPLVESRTVPAA